MESELDEILEYCRLEQRVCPLMGNWNELWKLLPQKSRDNEGRWNPDLPLILGAWFSSTDVEKRERLEVHLRWAAEHGALQPAADFLRNLRPDQWHYAK